VPGVYLEIRTERELVFTDAYPAAGSPRPAQALHDGNPQLREENGQTRYTARVRHWSKKTTIPTCRWGSIRVGANAPISRRRSRKDDLNINHDSGHHGQRGLWPIRSSGA